MFTNTITVIPNLLANLKIEKIISIKNYFTISSSANYGSGIGCGTVHSNSRSFTATAGSKIKKVKIDYNRDDQLQILVNGHEIFRSSSNLYCGLSECGQGHGWYSSTVSTSYFIDGYNTISFVNYNSTSSDGCGGDGDDMFYYANLTLYYE